jgi:hypothetical protein
VWTAPPFEIMAEVSFYVTIERLSPTACSPFEARASQRLFCSARLCVCVGYQRTTRYLGVLYAQHDQDDDRGMEGAHALPMHHKHDVHSVAFVAGVETLRAAMLTCVRRARGGVVDNISLHSSLSGKLSLACSSRRAYCDVRNTVCLSLPCRMCVCRLSCRSVISTTCPASPLFTYVGVCTLSFSRRARPVHILSPLPHRPLLHTRRYTRPRAHTHPSFAHFFAQDLDIDNIIARLLEGE